MKFYDLLTVDNFIYLSLFILVIFLALIIYNNYKLNEEIEDLKITHVNNFMMLLRTYETLLTIDVKGYFRSEDEVGIIFDNISEVINNYMEYLSSQINVLEIDDDNFLLLNDIDPIILNEQILNIEKLQKKITEYYQEEQSLKLKQKYEAKTKTQTRPKSYITK